MVTNAVSLHPVVPRFSTFKIGRDLPRRQPLAAARVAGLGRQARGRAVPGPRPGRPRHPPRVRQHRLPDGELHLRHRLAGAVVAREPRRRPRTTGSAASSPRCRSPSSHQMDRSIRAGHLVPVDDLAGLPRPTSPRPPQTDARFVFLAGEDNKCFLPDSQQRSFDFFAGHRPGSGRRCTGSAATATSTSSSARTPRATPIPSSSRSWPDERAAAARPHADVAGAVGRAAPPAPPGRTPRLGRRHPLHHAGQLRANARADGGVPGRRRRARPAAARRRAAPGAPARRPGLLVVTVVNYEITDIGKYVEYSLAIACTFGPRPAPPLLPGLLRGHYGTGPVRGRPAGQQRGLGQGRQGHLGHAQAPGQPRLHDHATTRCPASTTSTASSAAASRSTGRPRPRCRCDVGAANYCVFRGMVMQSSIYFQGAADIALGSRARAAAATSATHRRSPPLRDLDIDPDPSSPRSCRRTRGVLDDHFECWFLTSADEPAERRRGPRVGGRTRPVRGMAATRPKVRVG